MAPPAAEPEPRVRQMNACIISIRLAARQQVHAGASITVQTQAFTQGAGERPGTTRLRARVGSARLCNPPRSAARSTERVVRLQSGAVSSEHEMGPNREPTDATKRSGRRALAGRDRWRALALAASLAVAGAAVYMALHPVVLARAGSLSQITATLDGWQSALLLPLPGPDRRAGHASAELLRRLDHHATLALREVGTMSFAAQQTAARAPREA